jgi:charged multivesicular body protein 5
MKDTMLQVSVLKEAKASMDTQLKAINISDIEELQDDLQDMFDTNNEIQDLLSRSYATPDGLDDDDLEAELMTLEADLDDDTVAETPSYLSAMSDPLADLPQIPTAQPISQPALEMKLK